MARPAKQQPAVDNVGIGDIPEAHALTVAEDRIAHISEQYSADRDLLNQLLGQAQMSEAFAKFSLTVSTSKIAYIKENKLYRALRGMKSADGQQFSGTWEDFCLLLGRSRAQIDEDILNLNAMGAEALDSMNRMGIGYREMRQYRKLPTDAKEALIEAAKIGDKETLLDLAEELISRHVKEKTDLTAQIGELEANYEAQSRLIDDKNKKLDTLEKQLIAKESRIAKQTHDEVVGSLRLEVSSEATAIEMAIHNNLIPAFRALTEHAIDNGGNHKEYMLGLLVQIELATSRVREEFHFDKARPDADLTPVWMRPDADALLAEAVANNYGANGEVEVLNG